MYSAKATAHPNIAFIKYWGNRDPDLRIPSNGSISMNLEGLATITQVTFSEDLSDDQLTLNGVPALTLAVQRVNEFLNRVRQLANISWKARVESENNFPTGTGIASSASAFAALSLAASQAAGLEMSEIELSRLARTGSGSACRSVPGGYVEWLPGMDDQSSFAFSLAPPGYWELVDCIAVVSQEHKSTSSNEGHAAAQTSLLQPARVSSTHQRLDQCRKAILQRDFEALANVMELDSNLMHAVIMTQSPPLLYWHPATIAIMHAVTRWRAQGIPTCYTIDAGPNVHVICLAGSAGWVSQALEQIPGVKQVLRASAGGAARWLE